jgi:ketol-acid reductoisomerase
MVSSGILEESAYYESLHETPLIANLIARKKLYEMNRVISDTAEYGCYLFANSAIPMLENFMKGIGKEVIGGIFNEGKSTGVDNKTLIEVNSVVREHPIEDVGAWLRAEMKGMKKIV